MNLHLSIAPLVALIAGILILIVPRLLNYIIAIYLIVIGVLGLFGTPLLTEVLGLEVEQRSQSITIIRILGELGDVLAGTVKGRVSRDDVTLFKSLGLAVEDVASLRHIQTKALATGAGTRVALGGLRDG